MTGSRWKFAPRNDELSAQIAREAGVSHLLGQCLHTRGCGSAAEALNFLDPRLAHLGDPFLLPNMNAAVQRLLQAKEADEPFVIFGDYDVDGVTATCLLVEFFQALGWKPHYYLPHRVDEGYGLTQDAVTNCLQKFPVKLVLAVDCGSTAVEVIRNLSANGVEVLVLDHHQFAEPAPALALVNPHLDRAETRWKNLCSAGLAFKLAHAILKRGRDLGWPAAELVDLREWLDLVALGTIADLVSLHGENRILVRAGLKRLCSTDRPGLKALKEVAGLSDEISTVHCGFQLAPRLNAAGRLETALHALELLLCPDSNRAGELARFLDDQNRERQRIERSTADQVIAALRKRFNAETDYAIVEGEASWHIGVVGIVASRVLREFHRPTIIVGGDGTESWRGSGRSIQGFDLAGALHSCRDLLLKHGGHAMAAGLTMHPTNLGALREKLNSLVRSTVPPEALQPTLDLDAETTLAEVSFPFVSALEKLEPFGQGNPPVRLAARRLQSSGPLRRMGATNQHARFSVTDGTGNLGVVWWNCPPDFVLPARFDLAFTPELNAYNGTVSIQLRALDLKAC